VTNTEHDRKVWRPLNIFAFVLWTIALTAAPVFLVDELILGHPMPNWIAGLMGLGGGLVLLLWIRPWLLRLSRRK
jgi:hypothetical protein